MRNDDHVREWQQKRVENNREGFVADATHKLYHCAVPHSGLGSKGVPLTDNRSSRSTKYAEPPPPKMAGKKTQYITLEFGNLGFWSIAAMNLDIYYKDQKQGDRVREEEGREGGSEK